MGLDANGLDVRLGDHLTYTDWGLWLTSLEVDPAEPRTVEVDVPGMDGALDLTEVAAGGVTYKNREIRISLAAETADHDAAVALASEVRHAVHGLSMDIRTPETGTADGDPRYHGRVTVKEVSYPGCSVAIDLVCDCGPYLLTGTVVQELASGTVESVEVWDESGNPVELTGTHPASLAAGACIAKVSRGSSESLQENPLTSGFSAALYTASNRNLVDLLAGGVGLYGQMWLTQDAYGTGFWGLQSGDLFHDAFTSHVWEHTGSSVHISTGVFGESGFPGYDVAERATVTCIGPKPRWADVSNDTALARLVASAPSSGAADGDGIGLTFNAFTTGSLKWRVRMDGRVKAQGSWGDDSGIWVVFHCRRWRNGTLVDTEDRHRIFGAHDLEGGSSGTITDEAVHTGPVDCVTILTKGVTADLYARISAIPATGEYTVGVNEPEADLESQSAAIGSDLHSTQSKSDVLSMAPWGWDLSRAVDMSGNVPSARASALAYTGRSQAWNTVASPLYAAASLETAEGYTVALGSAAAPKPMDTYLSLSEMADAAIDGTDMAAEAWLTSAPGIIVDESRGIWVALSGKGRIRVPWLIRRGSNQIRYASLSGEDMKITYEGGRL